jgi:crotonobetaine/carnitine-CoA ligase
MNAPARRDDADNPLRFICMVPLLADLDAFRARFGIDHFETHYGMTETGTCVLGMDPADPTSCGTRRSGYELRLVDREGNDVPVGQVGELLVRHRHRSALNLGYLNLEEATAEAWKGGWFHTGDGLRVDGGGHYFFVDRYKDTIRRRGENISSFEVGAHVDDQDGVAESAAVGVPSALGEEDVKVFVVPKPGAVVDPEALHRSLRQSMPDFMVPRFVEIVSELPRTDATLRIRKGELRLRPHGPRLWDAESS